MHAYLVLWVWVSRFISTVGPGYKFPRYNAGAMMTVMEPGFREVVWSCLSCLERIEDGGMNNHVFENSWHISGLCFRKSKLWKGR